MKKWAEKNLALLKLLQIAVTGIGIVFTMLVYFDGKNLGSYPTGLLWAELDFVTESIEKCPKGYRNNFSAFALRNSHEKPHTISFTTSERVHDPILNTELKVKYQYVSRKGKTKEYTRVNLYDVPAQKDIVFVLCSKTKVPTIQTLNTLGDGNGKHRARAVTLAFEKEKESFIKSWFAGLGILFLLLGIAMAIISVVFFKKSPEI